MDSSAPDKTLVPSDKGPVLPYESPANLDKTPSHLNKSLVRKEKIVEAAFAIGAKQGLIGISARSVARDAGVSVGYLYKLFPSKSDIMVAAQIRMDSFLSHARSALEQVASQDERIAWGLLPPGSDVAEFFAAHVPDVDGEK